jgi:hypothetical protein
MSEQDQNILEPYRGYARKDRLLAYLVRFRPVGEFDSVPGIVCKGDAYMKLSILIVSVLRSCFEPEPLIGRTECHELNVLTNKIPWLGVKS